MASGTAFIPTPPVLVSLAFHRSLLSFILPYSSHTVISLSLISSFPFIFKYFIESAEHLHVYHLYFNPFITLRTSAESRSLNMIELCFSLGWGCTSITCTQHVFRRQLSSISVFHQVPTTSNPHRLVG